MAFEWFNKTRTPIGIDFGAHSIKMIQLDRRQEGYAVTAADQRTLPAEMPASPSDRAEVVAGLIRQMLEGGSFVGRRVVSCLPASSIQYKNLRLPRMPLDELPEAIKWEAADRLKLTEEAHQLQFFDAGEVRQGEELRREIILMAAPRGVVDEHLDVLSRCELMPVAIDAVPSALARSLSFQLPPSEPGAAHVSLDVGYSSSKVLVVRDGRVAFFKLIDIGGQKLDQTVAQHLGLPTADAAELRSRRQQEPARGEAAGGDPQMFGSTRRESLERAVFESLRTTAGDLAKEVALCLRYYSVTFRGRRPESLVLLGGEAYEPQLARIISEGADLQAEPIEPLGGMDFSAVPGLGTGEKKLCEWAVASGLAMRQPAAAAKRGAA